MFGDFNFFQNDVRKIPFTHMGTVSHSMPVKSSCRHKDTSSDFLKKPNQPSFAWKMDRKSYLGPKSLSLVKSAQGCVLSWCQLKSCVPRLSYSNSRGGSLIKQQIMMIKLCSYMYLFYPRLICTCDGVLESLSP